MPGIYMVYTRHILKIGVQDGDHWARSLRLVTVTVTTVTVDCHGDPGRHRR
jgi:hypothetical protein